MFEQFDGRSNVIRRCRAQKGCVATRFGSACNILLPGFTISGRSCHQNFGSCIVGRSTCLVKHDRTWTVFIS
jgi:hypothetical protein